MVDPNARAFLTVKRDVINHVDSLKICHNRECHATSRDVKLMSCSVCKNVRYCGRSCQRADWAEHKKACDPERRGGFRRNLSVNDQTVARWFPYLPSDPPYAGGYWIVEPDSERMPIYVIGDEANLAWLGTNPRAWFAEGRQMMLVIREDGAVLTNLLDEEFRFDRADGSERAQGGAAPAVRAPRPDPDGPRAAENPGTVGGTTISVDEVRRSGVGGMHRRKGRQVE